MDMQHKIPARSLCEALSASFGEIALNIIK
jgi:hypothetical protein